MKYAIFYLAVGDEARKLLYISYKTLRKAGFKGDVHILTDKEKIPLTLEENTFSYKIADYHLNLDLESEKPLSVCDIRRLDMENPRNVRNARKFAICQAKTLINEYVSLDNYDYIISLDVDILVAGPLHIFEAFLKKNNGSIITARNLIKSLGGNLFYLLQNGFIKNTVNANLTKWEFFKYWHRKPLCSNIVCFPMTERGKLILHAWHKELTKGIDADQAALQAVILRDFEDMHILAPYSLFGYGPYHHAYLTNRQLNKVDSVFVHFHGAVKDSSVFRAYYNTYINRKRENTG